MQTYKLNLFVRKRILIPYHFYIPYEMYDSTFENEINSTNIIV